MIAKRKLLAQALGRWPVENLLRRVGGPCLVALTYHRIGDADDLDSGIISTNFDEFAWQVGWLQQHVRVLGGDQVIAYVRGELRARGPVACVTFDDGYADNVHAGEVLAKFGVPAIFFVTSGFIGSRTASDWDRLAWAVKRTEKTRLTLPASDGLPGLSVELDDREKAVGVVKRAYRTIPSNEALGRFVEAVEAAAGTRAADHHSGPWMSWDDVRALERMGHSIGAHTATHPLLSRLTLVEQTHELTESKQKIEAEVKKPVTLLAYPVGKPHTFTVETKRLAEECGYAVAFSFYGGRNRPGSIDRFDVKRVPVERDVSRAHFRARVGLASYVAL